MTYIIISIILQLYIQVLTRCHANVFELYENEQMNALRRIFQQLLRRRVPQATANIHAACLWG